MTHDKQNVESMGQAAWYNQWILQKITKYLKGNILEVGFGPGNFTQSLMKYGQIWAIDIDPDYLKVIKSVVKNKAKAGFGDIEEGEYFFKNKKFDSIVCFNVLEHIKNDGKAMDNLSQLLKPKGKLALLVPAHQLLFGSIDKSIGHFRRYDKKRIIKIAESSNLKIIHSQRINFIGAIGWWFEGKVLKKKHINAAKVALFDKIARYILPLEDIFEIPIGTSILLVAQKNNEN